MLGEEPVFAVFAPGVPHRCWHAGDTESHTTGWVRPPDNIEFFLGSLFASVKANGGGRPSVFDAVFLIARYRSACGMLAIPAPVQRLLFPLVLFFGRLLGKCNRYKNAPGPVVSQCTRPSSHLHHRPARLVEARFDGVGLK